MPDGLRRSRTARSGIQTSGRAKPARCPLTLTAFAVAMLLFLVLLMVPGEGLFRPVGHVALVGMSATLDQKALRMSATSLRGISHDQPKSAARYRSVSSL